MKDEMLEISSQVGLYISTRDKAIKSFNLDKFAEEFESRLTDCIIWLRTGRI